MRKYVHSIGYALSGLSHAVTTERNFPLFIGAYILSLIAGLFLQLDLQQFAIVILSGGMFLAIELLNTALERFADAFDTHTRKQDDVHHKAIKRTKDVAAGAALIAILAWIGAFVFTVWPNIMAFL